MHHLLPIALCAALSVAAAAQSPGDTVRATESGTAFPADAAGAPLAFKAGDSFALDRTDHEGGRHLVYFRSAADGEAGGDLYRADAEAFGIRPPDPWAAQPDTPRQTRYAHGRVNVRSGPGTSSARVTQLGRDDFVRVGVCYQGWCRVAAAEGADVWSGGYVSESLLHEGPSPAARAAIARSGRSYADGTSTSSGSRAPTTDGRTCASFSSKSAAQATYDADPVGLRNLDVDGDGDACESRWRSPRHALRAAPADRTCYTGPRGGRYYYNSNGNKTYGC